MAENIPINPRVARKAYVMSQNTAMHILFAEQFFKTYNIELTSDEVRFMLETIESGSIPMKKIYVMAVVLLEEKF